MTFRFLTAAVLMFCVAILPGCEESDGVPYDVQNVQIAEDYLSEGYDIYMAVAFPPSVRNPEAGRFVTDVMVNEVLDYYQDLYRDEGKVKILVFRDPASAVLGVSDMSLGELVMENGEVVLRMVTMEGTGV